MGEIRPKRCEGVGITWPHHLPTYHLPTETTCRLDQFALTHVRGALVRLCEAVGSAFFGVLYDPCNLMQAGTDYRAALETFGPHITHVHLKDGFVAAGGEWERCELGKGEIDFGWVRAAAPPPTPHHPHQA